MARIGQKTTAPTLTLDRDGDARILARKYDGEEVMWLIGTTAQ
jgi:hypothetical protein